MQSDVKKKTPADMIIARCAAVCTEVRDLMAGIENVDDLHRIRQAVQSTQGAVDDAIHKLQPRPQVKVGDRVGVSEEDDPCRYDEGIVIAVDEAKGTIRVTIPERRVVAEWDDTDGAWVY